MHSENTKILEFNQYRKLDKTPSVIYADPELFIKKRDWCKNNPEKLFTSIVGDYIPTDIQYSMSMIWTYDVIENKHDVSQVKTAWKVLWSLKSNKLWKKKENDNINKKNIRNHMKRQKSWI